jgi:hypothetical protein
MSKEFCIRISVSMSMPKAFSNRKAISPDKLARPFSKLESAGRDTFKIPAASVTESPCASTT